MDPVTVVVKWLHLASAGVLVGAAAGYVWGVLPVAGGDAASAIIGKLRPIIHSAFGLLLLTGLYNTWKVMAFDNGALVHDAGYQAVLGIKGLLYVVAFALAIVALRRSKTGSAAPVPASLLNAIVWICILILALSAYLNIHRFDVATALK